MLPWATAPIPHRKKSYEIIQSAVWLVIYCGQAAAHLRFWQAESCLIKYKWVSVGVSTWPQALELSTVIPTVGPPPPPLFPPPSPACKNVTFVVCDFLRLPRQQQTQDSSDGWVELDSQKCGMFWNCLDLCPVAPCLLICCCSLLLLLTLNTGVKSRGWGGNEGLQKALLKRIHF